MLVVTCLAFADDLALLAETEQEAIAQIMELEEIAEKTGLYISFQKTEMITSCREHLETVETQYGTIKVVKQISYLEEIINSNGEDKPSIESRKIKLDKLNFSTKNIYNKRDVYINAKITH